MNICKDCKHARRGHAIDQRVRNDRQPPPPSRPSLRGGDFICGRLGLTPGPVDPQTGFQPLPSGPDCRDLNPNAECLDFVLAPVWRRFPVASILIVSIALSVSASGVLSFFTP